MREFSGLSRICWGGPSSTTLPSARNTTLSAAFLQILFHASPSAKSFLRFSAFPTHQGLRALVPGQESSLPHRKVILLVSLQAPGLSQPVASALLKAARDNDLHGFPARLFNSSNPRFLASVWLCFSTLAGASVTFPKTLMWGNRLKS